MTLEILLAASAATPEYNPLVTNAPFTFSQDRIILIPLIADMGKYFSAQPPNREEMSWKV